MGTRRSRRTVSPEPGAALALLGTAWVFTLPALVLRLAGHDLHAAPLAGLLGYGSSIVAAAFLLTWAAEVAQLEIGSGLAVVFLALVTVLPEYAVDAYLAWTAATVPENAGLALANMTGANRLLIGVGWPSVAFLEWYRRGRRAVVLGTDRSGDVLWLGVATLYSLALPLKGDLAWYDALVLVAFYALYVRGAANEPDGIDHLVGPARVMGSWSQRRRRRACLLLFVWSAVVILLAAEPFAESLKAAGKALGVPEYFLIQWLAPLASEAPEFVVVVLLTLRGRPAVALGAFISSKINQWTLLVAGVPVAYGIARVAGGTGVAAMPVDHRQAHELWLTAAQGLFATAAIADLRFSLRQAATILALFLVQIGGSIGMEVVGRHDLLAPFHWAVCVLYSALAVERLWNQRRHLAQRLREALRWATTSRAEHAGRSRVAS